MSESLIAEPAWAPPPRRARGREVAPHEFAPTALLYAPVIAQWLWLGLRHGGLTVPCLANPHVPTGGLCGESKTAILDAMAGPARGRVGAYAGLTAGEDALRDAEAAMARLGLGFPVVVKPDVGCRGVGVRLVADRNRLVETLAGYQAGTRLMIQDFIAWECEAGIVYSRSPDAPKGRILSVTLKDAPTVAGDGVRSLRALVAAHPRAGRLPHVYLKRLERDPAVDLERVLKPGERFRLVFTGNHSKGSVFRDAEELITPALEAAIDATLTALPEFHHGRVDLRFRDPASLSRGEAWKIIEINGIGSEPIGMWDPDRTPLETVRMLLRFWRDAFRIGVSVRARGHKPPRLHDVIKAWRQQERMIAAYPAHD